MIKEVKRVVERLKMLEEVAYCYNINGAVMGMKVAEYEKTMEQAADLIENLVAENERLKARCESAEKAASKWISVKDRLPEPGKRVLATNGYAVGEAYRDIGNRYRRYYGAGWEAAFREPVTHWQELPEPPGKEAPHE